MGDVMVMGLACAVVAETVLQPANLVSAGYLERAEITRAACPVRNR
jgi:hypothetical protein